MPDSLISTFAQGSTVGGFLVNLATIGHNAIFQRNGSTYSPQIRSIDDPENFVTELKRSCRTIIGDT
ncbi:hypothetical protein H2248_004510 [Termitomyces sp. 'cryptogamus']|nr:hypothetical protein H2248_004510 [Termitomyces sp. 'cryptogamus']